MVKIPNDRRKTTIYVHLTADMHEGKGTQVRPISSGVNNKMDETKVKIIQWYNGRKFKKKKKEKIIKISTRTWQNI